MTTKLILVRHGETDWNLNRRFQGISDIPLNEHGRVQAGYAREALKDVHLDAVYSSPLKRARETAEIICQEHSVPITTAPGLREQNVGVWEGLGYPEITERWPRKIEQWKNCPGQLTIPEGERMAEVQERAVATFWKIADAHPGETVLLASHMVCLSTILDYFSGVDLDDIWAHPIYNAGINVIEVAPEEEADPADRDSRVTITYWNYGDHLPEEERRPPANVKKLK